MTDARLREVVALMRELGVSSLSVDNHEEEFAVTLGPAPTAPPVTVVPKKPRRCACGHPLHRHNGTACVARNADRSPCSGKCRIIEEGEE